jgi:adenine-specific DNA-methyltransferase
MLMDLTRYELRDHAEFLDGQSAFRLKSCPFPDPIPLGLYELPRRSGDAHLYRLAHPMAQHVLAQARNRTLPPAEIVFDYTHYLPTVSILESLVGQGGSLQLSLLTVQALDQIEDYLLFAAVTESGDPLEEEQARRLLRLPASSCRPLSSTLSENAQLALLTARRQEAILKDVSQRNAAFFEAEANKLDVHFTSPVPV